MLRTFNPKLQNKLFKKNIIKKLKKVIESEQYILGQEVTKFEKKFSKIHDMKFSISTKNGTDSLILALRALEIKKDDEVITTAHTALATIASIVSLGAKPVIADIEKDFYTICPNSILRLISKKTKAIIPVHIYGQICDMNKIISISKKFKIPIIEDCAQAQGTKFNNKYAGSFGEISCFSFYPTKNLSAVGDGGMILTNNKKIYKKIKMQRQYGWDDKRVANINGINSRLDEVQAAILNVKINHLDLFNKKKNSIAKIYNSKIKNKHVILPKVRNYSFHSFHIYSILIENRGKFLKYLAKNKIYLSSHYEHLTFLNKGYKKKCIYNLSNLKNATSLSKKTVSLPIYPELKKNEIEHVIKVINNYGKN